jgi:alkaline phosphatase D
VSVSSRRTLLKGAVVLAALPIAAFTGERRLGPVPADPFTLGVASGEPVPDGVVIWTRLASRPLADDGFGGMPARAVDVEWEVAADEQFTRSVQRGMTTAAPEAAHSVHVELSGLRPGADYFYRFRAGGYLSPAGRTRTAPEPGSLAPLTMCVVSCSNYEHGWFTAYRRLADEHPDLVVPLAITNTNTPRAATRPRAAMCAIMSDRKR